MKNTNTRIELLLSFVHHHRAMPKMHCTSMYCTVVHCTTLNQVRGLWTYYSTYMAAHVLYHTAVCSGRTVVAGTVLCCSCLEWATVHCTVLNGMNVISRTVLPCLSLYDAELESAEAQWRLNRVVKSMNVISRPNILKSNLVSKLTLFDQVLWRWWLRKRNGLLWI